MTLRNKAFLLAALVLSALALALCLSSRVVLLHAFADLEKMQARDNMNHVLDELRERLAELDSKASDWADWDDAYAFVANHNQAFIDSNLQDSAFTGLRLDLMLFLDTAGRMVFGKAFDLDSGTAAPLPEGIEKYLRAGSPLVHSATARDSVTGILRLPRGALLVASRPILTSTRRGPARGSLIIGRFLRARDLTGLRASSHLSLTHYLPDDPELPADVEKAQHNLSGRAPVASEASSEQDMVSYAMALDLYGRPAVLFRATEYRTAYALGMVALRVFACIALGVGVVLSAIMLFGLEKIALGRLSAISGAVTRIGATGDLSARAPVKGSDELSRLGVAINGMLESLEASARRRAEAEAALRESHDQLEARVRERTAELAAAYEALRASEARFRVLVENASDVITLLDSQGRIVYHSPSASRVLGYAPGELVGTPVFSVIHPDDAPAAARMFSEAVRANTKEDLSLRLRVRHRDGSWRHMESIAHNWLDEPAVRAVVVTSRDVTLRVRAEEQIAHLASFPERNPSPVFECEVGGRVTYANPASRQMLGLVVGEQPPFPFCDRAWLEAGTDATGAAAPAREVQVGDAWYLASVYRPLESAVARLYLVDMTEYRRLEAELRQAQKMEAVGRLAGGVAHDFNNLLTPIIAYSQMLLEQVAPGDRLYRYCEQIARTAERAASLPRQLLAFSRRQVLQPRVLNLNTLIEDMGKMLPRLIGEDISLRLALDDGLGNVLADPGQIEQVIANLVVNARDAMPEGGTLTLRTSETEVRDGDAPGTYVVLEVSDTGCGMDRETQAKVFEPFFTTKAAGKGTGLGLSTVHGIVKQSGGHIRLESEPRRGTTFWILLPRVEQRVDEAPADAERAAPGGGTETVLLAEDDAAVRATVRDCLTLAGYQVLEADGGEQALMVSARHEGPIHLLLTDVVMPGMGGRELAERLTTVRPDTRVVFMSGYTDDEVVARGVVQERIAFIQKPVTAHALLRRVREVLDRKA